LCHFSTWVRVKSGGKESGDKRYTVGEARCGESKKYGEKKLCSLVIE